MSDYSFDNLIARVKKYHASVDEDMVFRAYELSKSLHKDQLRESGECYFSHPFQVACILADMKLDAQTIVTGLLHDVVEDSSITISEIEKQFGSDVSALVDGVTKISRFEFRSSQAKQAENFRKLLLATASDLRVLLVKLVDRLHNTRTLHYVERKEKQQRIARETLQIYAPLAERMGISSIQNELEDVSFAILYPSIYKSIKDRLDVLHQSMENYIQRICNEIYMVMQQANLWCNVQGREKTAYSIWKKMKRKNIPFEQLSDIMAFRIIVEDIQDCYFALGVIHSQYLMIPGRFKDYISTPKNNGYQSIHTGLIGPLNQRIEVQIRTQLMDENCRLGIAAHWNYKDPQKQKDGKRYAWLRSVLDILEHAPNATDFFENTRIDIFQDEVFCFSIDGQVFSLPNGSTALDFAYYIHSDIGNSTKYIKINGHVVELQTPLSNGDQVEVITDPGSSPQESWEWFVNSGRAKTHIRKFLKQKKKKQDSALGLYLFEQALKHHHLTYNAQEIERIAHELHLTNTEELWTKLGDGQIALEDIIKHYQTQTLEQPSQASRSPILASCCFPVKGDTVVQDLGSHIHKSDCYYAKNDTYHCHDVKFPDKKTCIGQVFITFKNFPGSLALVTQTIADQQLNIQNLRVISRTINEWQMSLEIEVRDLDQLNDIISQIQKIPAVSKVTR